MTHDLQHRLHTAATLRNEGYNCAQSVIMAFDDITGLPHDTALRITAALGAGVGAMGEICGVANAMSIVEGMTGGALPIDKKSAMARAKSVCSRFAEANGGCLTCRQLKRPGAPKPCNELIAEGITILHDAISSRS